MIKLAKSVILILAAVAFTTTSVAAQTGTGVDVSGSMDQSWFWLDGDFTTNMSAIEMGAAGGTHGGFNAYVVADPQPGPWVAPAYGVTWISRDAVRPQGAYHGLWTTFYTFFDAGSAMPLGGMFTSDNEGTVYINGTMAGMNHDGTPVETLGTFRDWYSFAGATTSGNNYVAVAVQNFENGGHPQPHGAILTFETETVPEPASLALLGTGILGILGVAYRRRGENGTA